MNLTINGTTVEIMSCIATFGELIDWVEEDLPADQYIVSVSIDGTVLSDYRDDQIFARDITAFGEIAIMTGDLDKVVRVSLAELDQQLKDAIASTSEIIRLLENRKEAEAYVQLAFLLESIKIFFKVLYEDLGWAEVPDAEISHSEIPAALDRALVQLTSAQENRYWVWICDVVEYEIAPILQCWQKVVERTRAKLA